MVDEVEFENMSYDENRDTPVIVKYFPVLGIWSICHAKSHQNAFRSEINQFKTKQDAIEFAENNNCIVVNKSAQARE